LQQNGKKIVPFCWRIAPFIDELLNAIAQYPCSFVRATIARRWPS
jgi:hypothetical protein